MSENRDAADNHADAITGGHDGTGDSGAVTELQRSLVTRCQKIMAHGWMIRVFIKHCDEVDDFPQLNEMARTIFDMFRAVETQVENPEAYFRTVRKKIGRLRQAAAQFRIDAWHASTHTNFQQAVIAAEFLGEQIEEVLLHAENLLPRPVPPKVVLPVTRMVKTDQTAAVDEGP